MLNRRDFCRTALLPLAAAGGPLPGCGGPSGNGASNDTAVTWADVALRAAAMAPAPGLPPFLAARVYAMAFLAAHDALNAIEPTYATSLPIDTAPGANADAAVATAVRDVLADQWPFAAAMVDGAHAAALRAPRGEGSAAQGVDVGRRAAAAILASRADDGLADIQGPYAPGTAPGSYRFTPPFDFAAFVNFGTRMKPFAIASADAFRAPAPYAVTDPAYAADHDEVRTLGAADDATHRSARTDEQTQIGRFWLENTPDSWMRVLTQLGDRLERPLWSLVRAIAVLQMAQTDAYIANMESKYHHNFWRPITAIRLGDADGNPATAGDPTWTSMDFPCPPIPDYPSGHAAAGGCGEAVLAALMGTDAVPFSHTSTSLAGVTRQYTSFSQASREIADSRIYVGYHFRLACTAGRAQGRAVGASVVAAALPRR